MPRKPKRTGRREEPSPSSSANDPLADEGTLVIETLEQFKALGHPLRQQILERFAVRPQTTKQVADLLGEKPTRLYHHVAALERAGLIRLVETRPKRGTTEKYYSTVAKRLRIDPRLLAGRAAGSGTAELSIESAGLGVVDGLLENVRRELAQLMREEASAAESRDRKEEEEEEALFLQFEVRGDEETLAKARAKIDDLIRSLQEDEDSDGEPGDESVDDDEHGEARRLILGWYPLPRGRA